MPMRKPLQHDCCEPQDIAAICLVDDPEARLDYLMIVAAAVIMFSNFFHFNDATEVCVRGHLITAHPQTEVFIPHSKTCQRQPTRMLDHCSHM